MIVWNDLSYFVIFCRDNMERNIAALRLQELYRKRQEEREKEEREMMNLKQPVVKQVFRGHRNARTMVRLYISQ